VLGRHDLAWGWLRSPSLHQAIVESQGFALLERRFFDAEIRQVPEPWRIAGFQLPNGRSTALNLLFRKNDAS